MRLPKLVPLVAAGLFLFTFPAPAASIHEFVPHTEAPPTCEPTSLAAQPLYARPLVKDRWDRAFALAPNVCLLPAGGAWWDCNYVEALPDSDRRICFWPGRDESQFAGDGSRLEVFVDLGMLRRLAQSALGIQQVQDLVGTSAEVEVRVGAEAARLRVVNFEVAEGFLLNAPPVCTPLEMPADRPVPDARGVCASRSPPRSGACRAVQQAPDPGALLCWWGKAGGEADFVIEVSPDALRGILNADQSPTVAKWALSNRYLTLWARDVGKRAAIRAALEFGGVGDVPDPTEPIDNAGQVTLQGRLFQVSYFPRDGVLAPCARDGQGTWYWLNEFGAPNGFVGPSTVEAMKIYLEQHGQLPDEEDVLTDLILNYLPGGVVETSDGPVTVVYRFAPGSPFALIPMGKTPTGNWIELKGDGTVARALGAAEGPDTEASVAAAKSITDEVDFNRQPGTLAQDLRFLKYAISRNPAAPQIETVLRGVASGIPPQAQDVDGIFPPQAPRLAFEAGVTRPAIGAAVAGGDSLLLGMASHTLIWQDLLSHGAIQPEGEVQP
ncbi:MAG: hypothetical protein HYT80_04445 [Euryarchaeota archaeon]|nr:hypothetical protein [Euryarchaeota archaeon]